MLDDVWNWGLTIKEALVVLRRKIETNPENVPPKLASLPGFATKAEALDYLNRAMKETEDYLIVALWARFETILLKESVPPPVRRKRKQLLKCMEAGSVTPQVREDYPEMSPEMYKKVVKVYKYRSWVAHGKRRPRPAVCSASEAYRLLTKVLDIVLQEERK